MNVNVNEVLALIPDRAPLPALAGALLTSDGMIASGVAGVRKVGSEIAATLADDWHLGSNTKAMTATLIGRLIDAGRLTFESTIADIFPDLTPALHESWQKATVEQLLAHRAGLPPNADWRAISANGSLAEQRLAAVKAVGSAALVASPGASFGYSNWGYVVLGAVAERIAGQPWEELIREWVFGPLKMERVGFGGTGTRGEIDQPWPHVKGVAKSTNGPKMDNPPVLAPAGGVHCPIGEWAKFIANELRGLRGGPTLLSPGTFARLHLPPFGGNYAGGWIKVERNWANGAAFTHSGSNTMNYAVAWLAPNRDLAALVCTNDGGDSTKACDEAVGALLKIYGEAAR